MITLEKFFPAELAGEYEPLAVLHEGQKRQTLLLRHRLSGDLLVMKRSLEDPECVREELHIMKELAGEGIPTGYWCFQTDDASYLLREYIPGETLLDYVQKKGACSAEEAADIGVKLCNILKRLHDHDPPVIHRDIKAENIIRTPEGKLYLIDFGTARLFDSESRQDTQLMGTPSSAAPEQFGYCQTDPRADIYAIGCLLHELTTGEMDLKRGQRPPALRVIIQKCVRFDPAKRYSSATALAEALKRAVIGRPKRRRCVAVITALAVMMLILCYPQWLRRRALAEIYTFSDPIIEAEVCRQLGKGPGTVTKADLREVSSILLCGDTAFQSWDQMLISGESLYLEGIGSIDTETHGSVSNLADIPQMPNLRQLALLYEDIEDLSPLEGLALEQLALHGNRIRDINPLKDNPSLQQLYLSANPITDLSPLSGCSNLWNLNIGATDIRNLYGLDGLPSLRFLQMGECPSVNDLTALADFKNLNDLAVGPVNRKQLEVLPQLTGLEYLTLWGWDEMYDVSLLSDLTELKWLYLDMWQLSSLEGIENLSRMENLTIHSDLPLSLAPLMALTELQTLDVRGVKTDDWSVLNSLPKLEHLVCTTSQEAELVEALTDVTKQTVTIQVVGK